MKKIFFGGTIITMTEPLVVEAVIVENGKIIKAGKLSEIMDFAENCQIIDLKGKTMMPSFIDAHSHFAGVANSTLQASLDEVSDFETMKEKIENFIEENHIKNGEWVSAGEWDNTLFENSKIPSLEEIDSIAPNNPLVIHHKSGHMGLINSKGMEKLNIDNNTKCPEGGKIGKENGKLNGYFEENEFIENIKKIPMPSGEDFLKAFIKAQDIYLSYGITSLQDGMAVKEMLPLYDMLISQNALKVDLTAYVSPEDYVMCKNKYGKLPPEKHFKIGGIKIFLDGSPQGRTAWVRKPYENSDDYCGYGTMTDDAVCRAMELSAMEKAQLICHCNGDAAAEQFLRCLYKTENKYPELKKLRPVIIHGQLMGKDQISVAKELGAMVSFFIAHIYHWGDIHIKNFGMKRASTISCAGSALKENLKFTFHQDAPVIKPNMLETVWCAVCRKTKNGVTLGEDEKISVFDALMAVTYNSAYQYFEEHKKGTIAINKNADFVILDANPFEVLEENIPDINILATFKNGECLYKK